MLIFFIYKQSKPSIKVTDKYFNHEVEMFAMNDFSPHCT